MRLVERLAEQIPGINRFVRPRFGAHAVAEPARIGEARMRLAAAKAGEPI